MNPDQTLPPQDLQLFRRGEANPDLRRYMPSVGAQIAPGQLDEPHQIVRVRSHDLSHENVLRDRRGNNISIHPGQTVEIDLTHHDIEFFKEQRQPRYINGVRCQGMLEVLDAGAQSEQPAAAPSVGVSMQSEIPVLGAQQSPQLRPNQEDEDRRRANTDHRPKR